MSIRTDETTARKPRRSDPPVADTPLKDRILDAAIALSEKIGYQRITRDGIAVEVGCAQGSVNLHYGTLNQLQRAVVSAAIARKNLNILAQALAAGHPKAQNAPQELRIAAANSIIGG